MQIYSSLSHYETMNFTTSEFLPLLPRAILEKVSRLTADVTLLVYHLTSTLAASSSASIPMSATSMTMMVTGS